MFDAWHMHANLLIEGSSVARNLGVSQLFPLDAFQILIRECHDFSVPVALSEQVYQSGHHNVFTGRQLPPCWVVKPKLYLQTLQHAWPL